MSCPKTQHLLQEYFADDLSAVAKDEIEKHLACCEPCDNELDALLATRAELLSWQEQRVPHWDRSPGSVRQGYRAASGAGFWSAWQWLPTAASFAMLAVLLLNVSITNGEQGIALSFGINPATNTSLENAINSLRAEQQTELQALVARVEDRLDSNNVRLLQAVMEQTQQTTADNFEQLYAYFEQQRLLDLQDMRVGYEELVNSDYETIRSLQQLATFVSYEGGVR